MQGVKPAAAEGDDIGVVSTASQPSITKNVYVEGIFSRINAVS